MQGISVDKVRIPFDKVLLKLKPVNEGITFTNGQTLLIDHTFNPANHQNVVAQVVKLPLNFTKPSKEAKQRGIEWLPDLDLEVGDMVIVDYYQVLQHFGDRVHKYSEDAQDLYIEEGGEFYVFVNYHEIFCKTDPIVPLNGWVIYEGIHQDKGYKEFRKTVLSEKTGVVKYLGKPNLEYQDKSEDVTGIAVGDTVVFRKGMYRKLEFDMHATQEKNLYLTQRKWILGVLEKSSNQ